MNYLVRFVRAIYKSAKWAQYYCKANTPTNAGNGIEDYTTNGVSLAANPVETRTILCSQPACSENVFYPNDSRHDKI